MTDDILLRASNLNVVLADRPVLQDVSAALPARHLAAVVGPNGAGKTTLLRALAGLVDGSGDVQIGNTRLSDLSLRERARRIGYLPQGHVVHWPLTAHDVVALGRYPYGASDPTRLNGADETAVTQAMELANVTMLADRTMSQLSGGERSRVALARVFALGAPIILADEPTASLDPRHQIEVMQRLRAAADDGTLVVVVTHDLGLAARFSDSVLVLQEGRLITHAPPAQALSDEMIGRVFQVRVKRGDMDGALTPWAVLHATPPADP